MEPQGRDRPADETHRPLGRQVRRPDTGRNRHQSFGGDPLMKVVLFCGGLGTRIREYSEAIPKPMIPIGHQPILWHVMEYYSQSGHTDFVLCLGYKANVIKDFFLGYRPQTYADCVVTGGRVELLEQPRHDWRVTLIDTGIWRNIGERLWAVREQVRGEEMFLANYSDGLTDVNLADMVARFKES